MPVMVHPNKERPFTPIPERLLLQGPNEAPWDDDEAEKQRRIEHLRATVDHLVEPERFKEFPRQGHFSTWNIGEDWEDQDDQFAYMDQPVKKEKSWVQKLADRSKYTPDFRTLKFQSQILIFVYGCEKRNKLQHRLLDGATPLGGAHTAFDHYMMKEILPGIPVVLERPTDPNGAMLRPDKDIAAVRGELYIGNVEHVHNLDEFHLNGIRTQRRWRHIYFETQGIKGDRNFRQRPCSMALMWTADKEMFSPMSGKTIAPYFFDSTSNPNIPSKHYVQWIW